MAAKAGVFISVVGKNDPRGFASARAELRRLEAQARTSAGGIEGALARASSKLDAIGSKMRSVGRRMTLGISLPVVALGAVSFKLASDLEESQSKVQRVFGRTAESIERFASTAAEKLGMSRQEALEGAGTFGNLFRAMDLGAGVSAKMSTKILQLGADLASFNNASPEDVLLALRSGLVGETEPLRQFGINLNEARIKAEALALGLVKGTTSTAKIAAAQTGAERAQLAYNKAVQTHGKDSLEARSASAALGLAQERLSKEVGGSVGNLTAAQKAQAAYSLIMKDSKLAQGDYARTAGGAANQQRTLIARLKDTGAVIGSQLLPIGTKLLSWVSGLLAGVQRLPKGLQTMIVVLAALAAAAGPVVYVLGALATALGVILSPVGLVVAAIVALVAAVAFVAIKWDAVWSAIRDHPALAALAALIFPIIIPIVAIGGAIHWLAENWQSAWAAIQGVLEQLRPVVDAVVGFVGEKLDELGAWVDENRATFEQAFSNIATVVSVVLGTVGALLGFFIENVVRPAFQFWLSVAVPILVNAWDTIRGVIDAALKIITGIIQVVMAVIAGDWGAAWDGVKRILAGVWDGIHALLSGAVGYLLAILSGAWRAMLDGARLGWEALLAFIRNVPGWILDILVSLPGKLLELGKRIVEGIRDGIRAGWDALVDWLKGKAKGLLGAIVDIFKPGSPSRVTRKLGQQIVEGLAVGMAERFPGLEAAAARMSGIVTGASVDVGTSARRAAFAALPGPGAGGALAGAGGGVVVHVQFGDVRIDARGATDPDRVAAASKDGLTEGVREITRMIRAS